MTTPGSITNSAGKPRAEARVKTGKSTLKLLLELEDSELELEDSELEEEELLRLEEEEELDEEKEELLELEEDENGSIPQTANTISIVPLTVQELPPSEE